MKHFRYQTTPETKQQIVTQVQSVNLSTAKSWRRKILQPKPRPNDPFENGSARAISPFLAQFKVSEPSSLKILRCSVEGKTDKVKQVRLIRNQKVEILPQRLLSKTPKFVWMYAHNQYFIQTDKDECMRVELEVEKTQSARQYFMKIKTQQKFPKEVSARLFFGVFDHIVGLTPITVEKNIVTKMELRIYSATEWLIPQSYILHSQWNLFSFEKQRFKAWKQLTRIGKIKRLYELCFWDGQSELFDVVSFTGLSPARPTVERMIFIMKNSEPVLSGLSPDQMTRVLEAIDFEVTL